jgi:hypothetical protein
MRPYTGLAGVSVRAPERRHRLPLYPHPRLAVGNAEERQECLEETGAVSGAGQKAALLEFLHGKR